MRWEAISSVQKKRPVKTGLTVLAVNDRAEYKHPDLQADSDLLGERALGEHDLHMGNDAGAEHAPVRPNGLRFLPHTRDHRKVVGEVHRQDPRDPLLVQLLRALQIC